CSTPQDDDESDPLAACQDGNDNDNDGLTDMNDPGCSSPQDNDESDGTSECQDGIDNDGDIVIDMNDPGCSSPQDDDESDATTECQDNIDNDNDGASDYPNDFGCDSLIDNDESDPLAACQDGNDNDNDGLTDMNDPGCSSPQDNDESDGTSECQDGIDNDQDGATDYPNDFSCDSPQDDDETGPKSGCQDGIDNDNDGFIDMNDPGCTDPQDNDETNVFKCSDGIDNDNDGATDFPDDFSCSSLYDDDETNPKSECQDGIDNDGDNVIDSNDPGCSSNQDNFEGDATTECQDGIDNDQDGATDYPNDFSCSSPIDDDETGPKSGCQDGIDNDNDGLTDMNDPGCTDPQDDDESDATSQCQDGIDNDNDGATDYPYDFSCDSPQDDNENDPLSGCQDGIDNDNDGLTDMNDPGCTDPQDNDEYNLVQHDLFITKSGPVSVQQGNTVLYTLTATNLGPQTATNVHIIDEIPTGLTLDAVNSSPNCVVIGSNVICNNFSLQDNESRTVNIAFQVGVGAACGSSIKNVGIVNTSATDPNPSNNRMEVFTDVTCQQTYQCSDGIDNDGDGVIDYPSDPDCTSPTDDDESPSVQPSLSIQKTDGRTTAAPGDVLTYTITIQNNSSVDAYGVDVSDNLPPEVEFISATYSPVLSTLSSGNMILLWSGINVPAHQSTILTVTARVRNNVQNGAHIVNAARVNNGINTYDSTTVEIAPQTGCVEVYVNALNSQNNPVSPTPAFGFKLENGDSLTNDSGGYARFGNVSVGSHTVSYIPTLGWQQNNVSPTNGIVFVQSNSACAQATFTIKEDFGVQQPSFSVSKTDNAGTIQPGQTLTYSIEVTNTSSVPATSVRIVDQLPAELTFISAANNGTYINGEVLWENITLQPNQSITLQVTTQVKPNVSPGTVILNIAQVIGNPNFVLVMAGVGSNFAADAAPMRYEAPVLVSAQDTTTVRTPDILVEDEPRPSSDSTITLRDSVDPVELGESFTYTIAITNMSDSAINGETVDQEIDPNLLVSSVSDSGRAGKGTIKWENISIPANTTRTLSATVSVEPTAQQNSTLLSSVTMNELSDTESTVINNSNTSSCQTEDVTITSVSDTSDPVAPGQEVQYFITLENSCSETTTQMVTAWLDGKSTFVSASDNGSSEGSIVKWNNLNIQPGTTQLRVTAKVSESVTSGQLQFSAKILGSERSETTRIEQSGNIANEVKLQVQQSANTQEAQPGNSIKYIVTVTNPSNDAANNVIVENRISAGTVSITDTNGGTNIGNGIKWTIPTLQPLESKSFSYTVRIDNSMRHGQTVRNTVTAISDNSGVHAVDTEEVRILTVLPQTGITSYKSLSATLSPSMKNQKVTAASIAGTTVFILWTSLISIGMTAGGVVGRRFWL
ncbi:DUF11 domain-containing protein, partial [Candidatus Peregrinibacteria bacterium]|nr:DUF11 domain-containing protein [Candidatus Peregrinibacteria bacterium]